MEVGSAPPGTAAEQQERAKALEKQVAADARKSGAEVFQFDPDASPEEKAAQAKKAIPPELKLPVLPAVESAGVSTDIDSGLSAHGNGPLTNGTNVAKSPMSVNGFSKAGDGDWSRTGWEPRFGSLNDALGLTDAVSDHQTVIERHLDDKFFGDWYHNAGVIIFACLATWFVTILRMGFAWMVLILACCATYYRTSIRRVRRHIRDDLNREFSKERLATDVESLEWINTFLVKFWPIYQPVLAATVINIADGILASATPSFLDSLRLTTFTLGTKPPRVEFVKSYPKTDDDVVEMDWKFSFTPNDTSDLTSFQLKNKVNPKVVLEVRVGKGIASTGIPIVVEDMTFSGIMKIRMKLQIPFPHVEKVNVCFIEEPSFDFVLKPVGGETFGIDIGFLPGLQGFIKDQVHSNLGPMFYAPNTFTLEIAKILSGAPIDQALGVLQVTIYHAQGLKNSDNFGGTIDPYAVVSISNTKEVGRTKTIHDSTNPRWHETKHIIITSFHDAITFAIFDYNEFRKDKELGQASFGLESLEHNPEQENVVLPIMSGPKQKGQIQCDFRFFPVLEGKKLEDGTIEPVPETNTGIVKFTIHQAKDLDHTKSMIGNLTPYAVLAVNNKAVHQTKPVKRNNSPIFEDSHQILVTNRRKCMFGLQLKDDRDLASHASLGNWGMNLDVLLQELERGNDWFNLANTKSGRVKVSAQWRPVALKGVIGGSGYITPIGVMRFHIKSAKGLRNVEAVGKSDPYVRVMLGGVQRGRTVTFESDLNPKWDEVLYVPVHASREKIMLEIMDAESVGSDRLIGAVEVACSEYIREAESAGYLEHTEKVDKSEPVMYKRSSKGVLNFTAAFYPCLNVVDPEEEEVEKKEKEREANELAVNREAKPPSASAPVQPLSVQTHTDAEGIANAHQANNPKLDSERSSTHEEKKPGKVHLTPEQLVQYNSGLLICKIIEGELCATDCYLELVMDDMLFPAFSTPKIRSKSTKFEEIAEAVVRELDVSRLTLRLRESGKGVDDENSIIAKLNGNTLETLKQCLNNPTILTLRDNDGHASRVKISLKYIPIMMSLDPSESINNMGDIRVDVLDAANLRAGDRNGKSDPYVVFELNDQKVFKSKVIKKTLHPAWNEFFETKIPSRTAAEFRCIVYDWDLAGDADFLGKTTIGLTTLEPFKPSVVTLKLLGKKGEVGDFGEIRLRLLFKPAYVVRSRHSSSTFAGTFAVPGKIVTGVAGAPIKGVALAAGGIGKGASFIARGLRGRSRKENGGAITEEEDAGILSNGESDGEGKMRLQIDNAPNQGPSAPTTPSRHSLSAEKYHVRSKSQSSVHSTSPARPATAGSGAEQGVAIIRLVSATGFPVTANVRARIRLVGSKSKEILKSKSIKNSQGQIVWDEQVMVNCTADQQFSIYVEDDHLFTKDQGLGEGYFVVDDTGTGRDTEVRVGEGKVILKTSFKPKDEGNGSPKASKGRGFLKK